MNKKEEKTPSKEVSEKVLETVGKIIPGFHGFFKRIEKSMTFGPKVSEIRKEIERRFGKK